MKEERINRSQKSLINMITSVTQIGVNGLLGLILTRLILVRFGSDFNGLNATALQVINLLMVVEGGFTLASNVALFKPYINSDYGSMSRIITASRERFKKIGVIFFALGTIIALGYSLLVQTQLSYWIIFSIFIMIVIPNAFDFLYSMKYRLMIQAEQKEYVISLFNIASLSLGYILTIAAVRLGGHLLYIRFIPMICSILNSVCLGYYCRQNYRRIDLNLKPDASAIKGTRDVFVDKIAVALFDALPLFLLSAFPSAGTLTASVYAVYNSVFSIIKGALYQLTAAPRLSFGALIADSEREKVYRVFLTYELVVFMAIAIIVSLTMILILPFVDTYTAGVSDIGYHDQLTAFLFGVVCIMGSISIPCGQLIYMSGNFRTSKIIQMRACIVLVMLMVPGLIFWSIKGLLIGILLSRTILAVQEIRFIHKIYFKKKVLKTLRMLMTNILLLALFVFIGVGLTEGLTGYVAIGQTATIMAILTIAITIFVNYIVNRNEIADLLRRYVPQWLINKYIPRSKRGSKTIELSHSTGE